MEIKRITTDDLRGMCEKEGLVLQGCGGKPEEWVDGMNDLLTQSGILLEGTKFNEVFSFSYGDLECLLFPFDDVKLEIGRFAMWRLQTHHIFGGTWLSDFVPNRLGGFLEENRKPDCPLIGQDGNIFNLIGIASRTLKSHGMQKQAKEMCERVYDSGSYQEALCIIGEYVNITSTEQVKEQTASVRQQLKSKLKEQPEKAEKPCKQQER